MKILGIDPGLERVGFGLIECDSQQRYHAKDWGVITTSKHFSVARRLSEIHQAVKALIAQAQPDIAAIEQIYFFRNAKTLVPVCQARGAILVAMYDAGLTFLEYTPMQVKMNMTGYGKADKKDVQLMVKQLLDMDELPKPDDAADALALALSCAFEQGTICLSTGR